MSERIHADRGLRDFFINIYQYVGLNLILSGAVAMFVASNAVLFNLIMNTPLFFVVVFAPVLVGMYVTSNLDSLSTGAVQLFYWMYGVSIGASLSSIFMVYTSESVVRCFLMAGVIFVSAAIYGKFTSKDLSSMGSVLMIGLIGLIVVSLINFFMCSAFVQYLLSWATIGIFTGFIAFDMQRLQSIYYSRPSGEMIEKISIFGALQLYISFVNIFIALLSLFGDRRRK